MSPTRSGVDLFSFGLQVQALPEHPKWGQGESGLHRRHFRDDLARCAQRADHHRSEAGQGHGPDHLDGPFAAERSPRQVHHQPPSGEG